MTLRETVRAAGFKDMKELVAISGISRKTWWVWFKNKPLRFEISIKGAAVKRLEEIL